jgi:hypothetical protein
MKRANPEYLLYKQVSTYLKYQYPKVLYRFDMAGLNLSIAQAGMNKAIQCGKGYPDLVILEKRGTHGALFIEIKPEGTKLFKFSGELATPHIQEQSDYLLELEKRGYAIAFGIGFDQCKKIIDNYLKPYAKDQNL